MPILLYALIVLIIIGIIRVFCSPREHFGELLMQLVCLDLLFDAMEWFLDLIHGTYD